MYGGPLIRRGYPLLDDSLAHRARAAKRRWLKVLSTSGWKRVPRLSKAHSKTHSARFFFAAQTHRTTHELHAQSPRTPHVIYPTKSLHGASHITAAEAIKQTFTNANTREKLPEASPKGPVPTHLNALVGQRSQRTLVTQGLATRPPKPKIRHPN
jgi:hypothetical protein